MTRMDPALTRGFTLLELLVVISIIAILIGIAIPSFAALQRRAYKAVCISHMRIIHIALDAHMLDKNQWPQIPVDIFESDGENEYWKWWILTLEPYGASDTVWLCPADKVQKESMDEYNGSYLPAQFGSHHFTPYRWATQPWLLERGRLHKKGAHIMMSDGSIRNTSDAF